MNPARQALGRLFRFTTAYPILTVAVALALGLASLAYSARHLEFQTSQKDLISPDNRLVQLSEKIEPFDDLDTFIVAVKNRDSRRSIAFLKALVARLASDPAHYQEVFYRVDPDRFRRWALLYLDPDELSDVRTRLLDHREFLDHLHRDPSLLTFFDEINREMADRMVGELFTGFLADDTGEKEGKPLDLNFLIRVLDQLQASLDRTEAGEESLPFQSPWESLLGGKTRDDEAEEGYFWTDNEGYLLLFVTPGKVENSFSNALDSLRSLRAQLADLNQDFPEVEAGVTGQEALNEDEMGQALHDMSIATALSAVGLTLLLGFFWGGLRRPLLEMSELLLALSLTFGLTTAVVGHLNILSITFAPLLLGLGIDYGIHWFARYQEEQVNRGFSPAEAARTTMDWMGPRILLAGIVAALSFFPLTLTGFKGLVELGIITSMGMLMTTATTLCVLPSLALLLDRVPGKRRTASKRSGRKAGGLHFSSGRAHWIAGISAVALVLSLIGASRVSFDLNMLRLQSKDAQSVVWERKLLNDSQRSSMYGAVLARSLAELEQKARALEALPTVSQVHSVATLLPEDQAAKQEILQPLQPLLTDMGSFRTRPEPTDPAALLQVLGAIRFKMLAESASQWGADKPVQAQMRKVRDRIESLRQRLSSPDSAAARNALKNFEADLFADLNDKLDRVFDAATAPPMTVADLPRKLQQRFITPDQTYLIRVYPAGDIWEPSELGRFVDDLRTVDPDVIGDPVTLYVFTKAFRNACVKAALYAVGFIFVLLLALYRKPGEALLVITPLLVGTAWTLGLMVLFGVRFNLANSLFLPLVVGAGIEYAIVIVGRWKETGPTGGSVTIARGTVKGVVLAGLTTTVGFGSLTVAAHQGIHSLGVLAMVGSLSILAAAVLLLPSLMKLIEDWKDTGHR